MRYRNFIGVIDIRIETHLSAMSMAPIELILRLVAGVLLILSNAFLVAVEFGLTRARQYSKEEFVESGSRGLETAWKMTEDLEIYLTSCQVGISATSIALGVIAEPALAALFEPIFEDTFLASFSAGVILAFAIINLIHLTHGEQTPTYLGVEESKFVCKYGSIPLYWYTWAIRPIISVGDKIAKLTLGVFGVEMTSSWVETGQDDIKSRSQLRNRLKSMLSQQKLTQDRIDEVISALDIDNVEIEDIMVSKDDVHCLSTDRSIEQNVQTVSESSRSTYPLIGESFDDIRGMVYVEALARETYGSDGDTDLEELSAPATILNSDTAVSEAIDQFQSEDQEVALVADGDDDIVGLVTVTDCLEQLVGELKDPFDQ